ncbi:alpha/beta-hydrolase [Corynespora cassiicola Philippines]|uniref:Alpha/beta-hydrolase n=1 Tax=Corynespora cassiicola Philippines TaxID=1448308 RepID=A0A2T2NWF6_CORCC|nr:alpha/beta-hydrolase [Corynespora cassiicola Philippines]
MSFPTTEAKYFPLSGGETVFYREAGSPVSPTIVLLHGYPTSSHQFRNLIPILAAKYHVIAPDLPGFGFTSVSQDYKYTFNSLTKTIDSFLEEIPNSPKQYSIYIFDYGAPVGLRLALKYPHRIQAIISQNGNAYEEGLGPFWEPLKKYWADKSTENRDALRPALEIGGTKSQYFDGEPDHSRISPESYTLDQALLDRPGNKEIQLDLFYEYRKNLDLYPKVHEYFRKSQVPLLAVWGKNDTIFTPPGAEAFKRDLKDAEIHLWDGGHFLEESHTAEIGKLILDFLKRKVE